MSDAQNQVMREELFRNHRALIERFGPELSAMIEHRLMRTLSRQQEPAAVIDSRTALRVLGGHARGVVGRSWRRVIWRAGRTLGRGR
jgi:hypothetical protein